MRRPLTVILAAAGVLALCASCVSAPDDDWNQPTPAPTSSVSTLPTESVSDAAPLRLADHVIVPTSRWYSSIVFADELQPVFPYPLAVAPRTDGFTVALPSVTASATTIAAPFADGVSVGLGAEEVTVVAADAVAVTLAYADADGVSAEVTLAEGSPVAGIVSQRDLTLAIEAPLVEAGDGLWSTTVAGVEYGILAPGAQPDGDGLRVDDGATVQVFPVPADGAIEQWREALDDPITGVEVSYTVDEETAATRLRYTGTDATVLVPFGGHDVGLECSLGTFQTAYGDAPACAATELAWSVPSVDPAAGYDLTGIASDDREELLGLLRADLADTADVPADTYYGGKALARLGTMLSLARALDDADLAAAIADELQAELLPWLDADACTQRAERCFVFDDRLDLVVGKMPSFGSEEGNDHHFHYGYFLTAGAALAAERPELVEEMAAVLDVLAADVAAGSEEMPALRVFDPYRGHSWAGGLSVFADGNNQESSSEGVGAWNGLALWAQARENDELASRATWLLSAEADAAARLWLDPDLSGLPDGFEHTMLSLSWGGKRDYATWFSPEPSAILGIQLLPLSAVSLEYLPTDAERVAELVAEAGGESGFSGALGDYVMLYSAIIGEDELARAEALARERTEWDDGLSASAAMAWLTAVRLNDQSSNAP
ncbi:glycosyl hydrolase [Microbacterium sp. bgisy189]|uniref:glycosyl hydrolase n=1 Tax=Microbacterium sp. bgisy189 TaxID=3413798 RepID=UPI003EC04A4D